MDVTDVLRDRMHEPDGLQRMLVVSGLAHAALVAMIIVAPAGWFGPSSSAPAAIMTISLDGGASGAAREGMSTIGGRAVQAIAAPDTPKRPDTGPAAVKPEFVEPIDAKARKPRTTERVTDAPDQARGRTATRGAETTPGTAITDTGVRGQGFGLGGGGGVGSGVRLDVANFCCMEYIQRMREQVELGWSNRAEATVTTTMMFTINRDGTLTDIRLEKSSGYFALDLRAERQLKGGLRLDPLPARYTNPTLTVHLDFLYSR